MYAIISQNTAVVALIFWSYDHDINESLFYSYIGVDQHLSCTFLTGEINPYLWVSNGLVPPSLADQSRECSIFYLFLRVTTFERTGYRFLLLYHCIYYFFNSLKFLFKGLKGIQCE